MNTLTENVSKPTPFIFVVGNSRSGTTMMGRIMGNHPDIYFLNELHFFEQLATAEELEKYVSDDQAKALLMRLFTIQHDGFFHQGDPRRYHENAEIVMKAMQKNQLYPLAVFKTFLLHECEQAGKKYPCVHTPRNVFYLKEILALIPEARIINMIRDPRDVLLSQKRRWKRRFLGNKHIPLKQVVRYWVNYHPITISKLWNASVRAADFHQDHPHVFHLHFEELVVHPQEKIKQLCEFIGVDYHENMENVPQIGSSSGADNREQKFIDPKVAGRWKSGGLKKIEIALCEKITREKMIAHGYQPSGAKISPISFLGTFLAFPLKLIVAFFLNLHRMKSIIETLKRRLM